MASQLANTMSEDKSKSRYSEKLQHNREANFYQKR